MKIISIHSTEDEAFVINNFGFENISKNAHWGKGRRDMWILHFVISGEGYFNSHRIKSGQGFLIRPMELHEYYSSHDMPWSYLYITFSGKDADSICKKHIEHDERGIFNFTPYELISVKDIMFSDANIINNTRALGYFYLIASSIEKSKAQRTNGYVNEAKKYMQLNLFRPFQISEVARSIGISDRYLYNLFIAHEGCSVKSYLNSLKISHSSKLLKSTSYSITEIAFNVGFTDVLSFSKFFKKYVGKSPSSYRNQTLNDN